MPSMQGGCLCGAVRYTVSADPIFSGVCHCTNCQKSTGSAFSVVLGVPSTGVSITGETKAYLGKGDSGQPTTKRFCPVCGSGLTSEASLMQGVTMVEVGTLDEPSAITPGMHIYCDSKLPWSHVPAELPAMPKMPPMG